jgi:hypothetical protein
MSAPDPSEPALLEMWKLMSEMSDRVSQRRQTANAFYLSINTAVIGAAAVLGGPGEAWRVVALSAAGVAICGAWLRAIGSYKTLNTAKFEVIHALERRLPAAPYTDEWVLLDPDRDGTRHRPFHRVETAVPWIFLAVHAIQGALETPWGEVGRVLAGVAARVS